MKQNHAAWIGCLNALGEMRDSLKRGEFVRDILQQLERLEGEIRDLKHLAGDKNEMQRRAMLQDIARRR